MAVGTVSICHGPWVLISAGIVRGRRMTSTIGIRDDLVNAGAEWIDQPDVIDGNLASARVPKDLPAFGVALLEVLRGKTELLYRKCVAGRAGGARRRGSPRQPGWA